MNSLSLYDRQDTLPLNPCSLLLLDDHPVVRQGIEALLGDQPGFIVVGSTSKGHQAIALANEHKPDIILLDFNISDMPGMETLRILRSIAARTKVIVFTASTQEEDVLTAIRAGADGYLLKSSEPHELMMHLKQSMKHQMVISRPLVGVLAKALQKTRVRQATGGAELSSREKDILSLVVHGDSNKVIGRKLLIAEGTVKVHIKNILKKLGVNSRVEAAVWASEHLEIETLTEGE